MATNRPSGLNAASVTPSGVSAQHGVLLARARVPEACGAVGARRQELPAVRAPRRRGRPRRCARAASRRAPPASIRHTRTLPSRQAVATSPSSGLIAASPRHDASRIARPRRRPVRARRACPRPGLDVTASVPSGLKRAAARSDRCSPSEATSSPVLASQSWSTPYDAVVSTYFPSRLERDVDDPAGARLRGVDDLARLRAPEREHVFWLLATSFAAGLTREPV